MKQDTHPDYHDITVKMTNGETFKTRSTYGKEGDTLVLDVDTSTHPAWVGGTGFVNEKEGKVAKFNQKFGNFSVKRKASPAPEQKVEEVKEEPKEEAVQEVAEEATQETAPEATEETTTEEAPAEETTESSDEQAEEPKAE